MTLFLSSAQIIYLEYFLHRYLRYAIYKRPLLLLQDLSFESNKILA